MNRWNKQQAAGWAKTKTEDTFWKRVGKRLSLTPGQGQDGHIHEVLQEDSRSSMYKVYDNVIQMRKGN
jgi:hypothetical protein